MRLFFRNWYNISYMKIVIVGGSGFIGTKLSQALVRQGHSVISLDMNPPSVSGVLFVSGSCEIAVPKSTVLAHPDVVINLAGRSIVGPWNTEHKTSIYTSRIETSKHLIQFFKDKDFRPKIFIQASATGVYGNRGEQTLSEGSGTKQNTYLAQVAHDWEREGSLAQKQGIRTIIIRQGNVLGKAGLLANLEPFYKAGLGGPVGRGDNWFPWIHIDDLVSLYLACIHNQGFMGIINAVAPEVVRYKEFSRQYAKALAKPHFVRIPKLFFRFKYKGFTDEITSSQKLTSLRMWELGDIIRFKTLEQALRDILKV